ncbi:MAG TPA: phosphatase domain-containing protein [Phycisphaerae bacterium]|nr:phosphatase domain-containing protein [Phycisphaerae bacterium]
MARSCIDADETVLFFPTVGWREPSGWKLRVHGWIYEPVEYSRIRRAALWLTRRALRRRIGEAFNDALSRQRLAAFFADNERGERLRILCAGREFRLGRSRADGHFEGLIELTAAEADRFAETRDGARWIPFRAVDRPGDTRPFGGQVMLLDDTGVSIISDIDDTIKITGVLERRAMLRTTFCEAFASIPGMPELYRRLQARHHATFHYVSASPWQLYPFLTEGLAAAGFPAGTFHLRRLRFKGRLLLGALASASRIKRRHIHDLLVRFPNRRFVLVGDSGERDGVLYAALARHFPRQIEAIYIRDAGGRSRDWPGIFRGISAWRVFNSPADIH